jgi:hypothetical protein
MFIYFLLFSCFVSLQCVYMVCNYHKSCEVVALGSGEICGGGGVEW